MYAVAIAFIGFSTLTGGKADIVYSVTTKATEQTVEFVIDLSAVLDKADPETGSRKPLTLETPTITPWMPLEKAPRRSMVLWPGGQAGQYRARLTYAGAMGGASLRIDGKRDGKAFAIQLPAQIGETAIKTLPGRAIAPPKGEALLGDATLGREVFNRRCSCCHGRDATGEEGHAARLAEPRTQLELDEEQWLPAILLEPVARGEVAAFLKLLRKPIFPPKIRYLVRLSILSEAQKTDIRRETGVVPSFKDITLYPQFIGDGTTHRIPDVGRELDLATAKNRTGFQAFIREGEIEWLATLDHSGVLTDLQARNVLGAPLASPTRAELTPFFAGQSVSQEHPLYARIAPLRAAAKLAVQVYLAEETDRATFTP